MPCDTFVSVGTASRDGDTVFGKNSDRPDDEVQLVVFVPHRQHGRGEKLRCTHISIPQVRVTNAVLLSQPYWMWGAEMGVNEHGVAIGNEAVWTTERIRGTGLTGMDLLRLGLERGRTARGTLDVVTELLAAHGQGGYCSVDGSMRYHNSFIIADPEEAWVLETADEWWVAERVADGVRNISNGLSIDGAGDLRREGVVEHAVERGLCRDDDDFSFARCFTAGGFDARPSPFSREGRCGVLLKEEEGNFTPAHAMRVLRDHEGGICMHGGFTSAGSQVSSLVRGSGGSLHWFAVTAPPCTGPYLPFALEPGFRGLSPAGPHERVDPGWVWVRHRNWVNKTRRDERDAAVERLLDAEAESVARVVSYRGNPGVVREENEKMWAALTSVF
ncbi:MAG: C69 family dipeptidase [Promethearchaeota archaeon]